MLTLSLSLLSLAPGSLPAPTATTVSLSSSALSSPSGLGASSGWVFFNESTQAKPLKATVPGQIHTDLLWNDVITEPFNGTNAQDLEWVALGNWTYETTVDLNQTLLDSRVVQMVSMGIDTVAEVSINGKKAIYTDNMFHRIRADAKPFLKAGANKIRVDFTSKVTESAARMEACDVKDSIICPSGARSPVQHGFDNQNYLRTEPCSFSWDWGPGFAPMGLWRPIYFQAYDTAVVRDITVITTPHAASDELLHQRMQDKDLYFEPADAFDPSDQSEAAVIARAFRRTDRELDTTEWDADVTVYVDTGVSDTASAYSKASQKASPITGKVVVSFNGTVAASVDVSLQPGRDTPVKVPLKGLKGVSAWMPNEFGTQQLYTVSAAFVPSSDAVAAHENGRDVEPFEVPYQLEDNAIKGADGALSVRVGFRTVELVQDPLPGGKSYYFKVNGVPIPVKGSNWIPADAFESRVSRNDKGTTRLEPLFWALSDSHQNMIRNWGGGIYQRDSFYDLADEYGILIWEDLMFACADYAAPPEFLDSAAKEIRDNVLRMQSHPSIALWAGNNEDERDLSKYPGGDVDDDHIKAYSLLTFITGLGNVSVLDDSRPLSGSSPSDGNETAEHPFSWDHQSQFYGDVHCYLYDVDNWDVTAYKRPRFMSEFGLQSWPSALTMSEVFPVEQWSYHSDLSTNRNHHPNGQSQIAQQISMHFHLPDDCWPACSNDNKDYSNWAMMLWLSQLNQALGYKAEVEHFRRIRTDCSEEVAGCNMGRMYWQTNDIWQGASWAAVDYTGRYKMVQYFTKRFYEPVLVSAYGTAVHGDFGVSVINDHVDQSFNGTVRFTMRSWSGPVVGTWSEPFNAPAGSALPVTTMPWFQMLQKGNCSDATKCLLTFDAIDHTGKVLSSNYLLLTPFYDVMTMNAPNLTIHNITQGAPGTSGARPTEVPFTVTITNQAAAAAFVWAETTFAGRWSDNAIMLTDPVTSLVFYSDTYKNPALTPAMLAADMQTAGVWGGVTILKTGHGGLWSLADTSPEYTSLG